MDDAARELGLSPAQVRLTNFVKQFPYVSPIGGSLTDSDYVGTMRQLLTLFKYDERVQEATKLRAQGRKVGVAVTAAVELCRPLCSIFGSMFYNQPQYAAVTLRMHPDGSLSILSGDAPQGQARASTMVRVVARELGANAEAVEVYTGDTALSPVTNSNTDVTTVCAMAARRLRSKVLQIGSQMLEVEYREDDFACANGEVRYLPDGRTLSFRDIAWTAIMRPFLLPDGGNVVDLSETAFAEAPYAPTAFAAHAAMVEVDGETGKLKVLSYGFVGDAGKVMNARGLRTAVTAGIATGISNTTHEAYIYDDQGQLITSNLKDYAMLTANDMPWEVLIAHHDTPTQATLYGHKRTITEGVPTGVPPALANAIIDAYDGQVDIPSAPFFPADLWALHQRATTASASS
jgi:carbon-monoxide dehydrogenase large subunit